jgi:hypothetical protein
MTISLPVHTTVFPTLAETGAAAIERQDPATVAVAEVLGSTERLEKFAAGVPALQPEIANMTVVSAAICRAKRPAMNIGWS